MKDFKKFLEASVKGNPAIPGEGDNRKKANDRPYLSEVERRAKQRIGITDADSRRGPAPSATEAALGQRMMSLMKKSLEYTRGKEDQLSQLANVVFLSIYQELVTRYKIEIDIKIIEPGKVKEWADDQEDQEEEQPPQYKEVSEEDIKNEISKRKIANLIIQGEAKNTKHILHSDEVKEGLEEIYGREDAEKVFKIWDEMTKIADKLDWIVPAEVRAEMMEKMPEFAAGASAVGWKDKEKEEETEDQEREQEPQEEPQEEEPQAYTGEEDEEEMYDDEEGMPDEPPMERFDKTPIIRARGIDFPMLLHEAVKGLFEALSLGGIPEDTRTAEIALSNTGLSDEPEDWKYGPEIAADLRDFVNVNTKINVYPNVREEFYKMLIDKDTMPTAEFLELMRGILLKNQEARVKVDRLIDKVIETIKLEKDEQARYDREMEEYNRQMKEWEENKGRSSSDPEIPKEVESDIDMLLRKTKEKEEDYSTWSKREIQDEIDAALDNGDYEKVGKLTKYLKEGKEIYLREVKMLLEGKNPHTK